MRFKRNKHATSIYAAESFNSLALWVMLVQWASQEAFTGGVHGALHSQCTQTCSRSNRARHSHRKRLKTITNESRTFVYHMTKISL